MSVMYKAQMTMFYCTRTFRNDFNASLSYRSQCTILLSVVNLSHSKTHRHRYRDFVRYSLPTGGVVIGLSKGKMKVAVISSFGACIHHFPSVPCASEKHACASGMSECLLKCAFSARRYVEFASCACIVLECNLFKKNTWTCQHFKHAIHMAIALLPLELNQKLTVGRRRQPLKPQDISKRSMKGSSPIC